MDSDDTCPERKLNYHKSDGIIQIIPVDHLAGLERNIILLHLDDILRTKSLRVDKPIFNVNPPHTADETSVCLNASADIVTLPGKVVEGKVRLG